MGHDPAESKPLKMGKRLLRFVRRGSILVQRGNAVPSAFPPPTLGVSSLDLGRWHPLAAPFYWGNSTSRIPAGFLLARADVASGVVTGARRGLKFGAMQICCAT